MKVFCIDEPENGSGNDQKPPRFEKASNVNFLDSVISDILSIDRYISAAEKGANALIIQRPTMPKKKSPIPSLILAISVVLGGMVGVFFILIRNAITKRKEQLAEA